MLFNICSNIELHKKNDPEKVCELFTLLKLVNYFLAFFIIISYCFLITIDLY